MASSLNPSAPVWMPAHVCSNDMATKTSASSAPSPVSYNTPQPFMPDQFRPHHDIHPINPYQTYFPQDFYSPQVPPYFYPPAPYYECPAYEACDAYGAVDLQDPFALQMRQVENVKTGGQYRAWGVTSSGEGEGAWGTAGKKSYRSKRTKKFKKGRKGGGGWVGRGEWRETEKSGGWETKEEWSGVEEVWDERKDREGRKDSGVEVEVGVDGKEGGEK